jgi:hypothetical protein
MPEIITADGMLVNVGDAIFDYYSMEPGKVATAPDGAGWFDVRHDNGNREYLNGERICTLKHARQMGWLR